MQACRAKGMFLRLVRPGQVLNTTSDVWSAQYLIAVAVQYTPTDFEIRYTLRPGNVQDAPKTPLVKGINSFLYGFGYGPRLGSIQEYRKYINVVEPKFGTVLNEIMDRQMCLSNICVQLREMEMRLYINFMLAINSFAFVL